MAEATTKMKAPRNVKGTANIEGHQYTIPKDGVITLVSGTHVDTLKRHGFVDHFDPVDAEAQVDAMDDKDQLVAFIEERGGEADNEMGLKKLRRLAKEAIAEIDEA